MNFIQFFFILHTVAALVASKEHFSILEENNLGKSSGEDIKLFLEVIKRQQNVDIIINIEINRNLNHKEDCDLNKFPFQLNIPQFNVNENYLKQRNFTQRFTEHAIVLICAWNVLELFKILRLKAYDDVFILPHLIYLPLLHEDHLQNVTEICGTAFKFDIYNLILITKNMDDNLNYYKCRKYPPNSELYEKINYSEANTPQLYNEQFIDMYGDDIHIIPDQNKPRNMLYVHENGEIELLGYFGKMIQTFIRKRNATMQISVPLKIGEMKFFYELKKYVNEDETDLIIGTILTPTDCFEAEFTYPYDVTSYCTMIPLPLHVPAMYYYFYIIDTPILLVILALIIVYGILLLYSLDTHHQTHKLSLQQIFLNDKSLRGMLGQSFPQTGINNFNARFICFQICYASLMISTLYQAFLNANYAEPPDLPKVTDGASAAAAGLKVLFWNGDMPFITSLPDSIYHQNEAIFEFTNISELRRLRHNMDTRYIYPVSLGRWLGYQEQQEFFKEKVFYYNEDFCVLKLVLYGFPIRRRLPYRKLLDDFILQVQAAGFYKYWMSTLFYDMLLLQLTTREDLSHPQAWAVELEVIDFYWIGLIYFGLIIISLLTFLLELIVWKLHTEGRTVRVEIRRLKLKVLEMKRKIIKKFK